MSKQYYLKLTAKAEFIKISSPQKNLSEFPRKYKPSQPLKPSEALNAKMEESYLRGLFLDHDIKSLWRLELAVVEHQKKKLNPCMRHSRKL